MAGAVQATQLATQDPHTIKMAGAAQTTQLVTQDMLAFLLNSDSELSRRGYERDKAARDFFTKEEYDLYGQGTTTAIDARARADASGDDAVISHNGICNLCSPCKPRVQDKRRHNQEKHIKDPAKTYFCDLCGKGNYRYGPSDYDRHLATHNDYRNMEGHAGELLERSIKPSTFAPVNVNVVRYIAKNRLRLALLAWLRREFLFNYISQYKKPVDPGQNEDYLETFTDLLNLTLPQELNCLPFEDIDTMEKQKAVVIIILARKTWLHFKGVLDKALKVIQKRLAADEDDKKDIKA